jgi:hypothetical protein
VTRAELRCLAPITPPIGDKVQLADAPVGMSEREVAGTEQRGAVSSVPVADTRIGCSLTEEIDWLQGVVVRPPAGTVASTTCTWPPSTWIRWLRRWFRDLEGWTWVSSRQLEVTRQLSLGIWQRFRVASPKAEVT